MKLVGDLELSDTHKIVLARILNHFAEGGVPYADESTLRFFALEYARGCVSRALAERPRASPEGLKMAQELSEKLAAA